MRIDEHLPQMSPHNIPKAATPFLFLSDASPENAEKIRGLLAARNLQGDDLPVLWQQMMTMDERIERAKQLATKV